MTETEVNLTEGLLKQDRSAQQQMLDCYGRDVFVKVFKHIGKYDAKQSSLRTWVSRIAYHEAISFLRRKPAAVVSYEEKGIDAYALTDAEVEETFGQPNAETVWLPI